MTDPVQAMADNQVGSVELADPEAKTETRSLTGDPATDWLCAWCHNRVASDRSRFVWEGRSEFLFVNPAGVRFDLLTFAQTVGCLRVGEPTLEHTWFPGHAWTDCACARCGIHLGWFYSGPHQFAGLIRDRLVRALTVLN